MKKRATESGPEVMAAAFLTEREVLALVGFSRMTLRRLEARGEFPSRRRLSAARVAWLLTEVQVWIDSVPKVRSAA